VVVERTCGVSLIDLCGLMVKDESEWYTKCPKLFSNLQKVDEKNFFCGICQKNVVLVEDIENLGDLIKKGNCISMYQSKTNEIVTKLKHQGFLGMDWYTKEQYDIPPMPIRRRLF